MGFMRRIVRYIRMHGAAYTFWRGTEILAERAFHLYDRRARRMMPCEDELAFQRANQPDAGLISIAVPVYNTRPAFLRELVESFTAQTYARWEAVLYDGGSTLAESIAAMDAIDDARVTVVHSDRNEGISGNTNRAVDQCRGEYIALCDHDDVLSPDALWRTARAIVENRPDLIYSDEDKITEDGRFYTDPHRKPDFCPDNLRSGNYICHLTVIRRAVFLQVGGLRPEFDGSQDHDLVLRISEVTDRIYHLPNMLYHWRTVGTSMSHQQLARCQDAAARAVTEHIARIGYPGRCTVEDGVLRLRYDVPEAWKISVIRLADDAGYAEINRAAARADGNMLLFIRESVAACSPEFKKELLMYAQREDVGAVTPMLIDRWRRVVHAGYTLKDGRISSRGKGLHQYAGGWHGMNRTSHNVMAVSSLCWMIRKDHFIPFDETWQGESGMADWCLRMREQGLLCVYTPHAVAVSGRKPRFDAEEIWRLYREHPGLTDPCGTA